MATHYLANTITTRVDGLVAIGISGSRPESERVLDNEISLRKIKLPILDIYGSEDLEIIMISAQERANVIAKNGNAQSKQVRIEGANHFYKGQESQLLETVSSWINTAVVK